MKAVRVLGVLVFVIGVAALVYGGLSYKSKSNDMNSVSRFLSVNDKRIAFIPIAFGVFGMIAGSSMFFERGKHE